MTLALAIGATLLLAAFYSWTGRINATFFFGRTVPEDLRSSDAGRAVTRRYLVSIACATLCSLALAWSLSHFGRSFAGAGAIAEALAFVFIFGHANRQANALLANHDTPVHQAVIEVPLNARTSYWVPSAPAVLAAPLFAICAFVIALFRMAHVGGLTAGWSALSSATDPNLATLAGMATGMLFSASALLLLFRTSARLRTRMAQYTVRVSFAMEWVGAGLLLFTLACVLHGSTLSHIVVRSLIFTAFAAALAVLLWNQSRFRLFVPPSTELGNDGRWRWGLFYVDRNDPALFVQSRCGSGYSLNFGRVLAWPIAVFLWGYLVAMLFLPHR